MKILVTGCAGFIGAHLCKDLLEQEIEVIGVDNLDPFYNSQIKEQRLSVLKQFQNFTFFREDVSNQEKIEVIFANNSIDQIVHIAARAGVRTSLKVPLSYVKYNIEATNILLEKAVKYSVPDFIFASSSSVYGNCKTVPFTENMELDPISPYAASKRSCELYGFVYSNLYDINFTALRLFTVYGPSQRDDMAISRFVKWIDSGKSVKLYGDGSAERDFTYIDDIVNGFKLALEKHYKKEVFNLGKGQTITMTNLIKLIEEKLGKEAKIEYLPTQKGDMTITFADISKTKKMLGYNPKVTIEKGIEKYVKWFIDRKNNPDSPII